MNKSDLNQTDRDKIDHAVRQVFGTSAWELDRLLAGGLSTASLYKITVADCAYVVRVSEPEHVHNHLEREFAAMTAAAEQQIAPQVFYANPQRGVLLMALVENQSIYSFNLGNPKQIERLAHFIHQMHQLPALPPDDSVAEKLDGLLPLCVPDVQANELVQKCMALKTQLAGLLADEEDKRPCHCDINPNNLLFDGEQLWLIDWASASQQSFYFDLACASLFLFYRSESANDQLLQGYLQRTSTTDEANKFFLMRQFVRVYYGLIFIYLGTQNEPTLLSQFEVDSLPPYPQFMQMLGEGKENLAIARSQQKMGFIHLKSVLAAQQTERFANVLAGLCETAVYIQHDHDSAI